MAVRYVFTAAQADAVTTGALSATLRSLGRKRHAKVGEPVTLAVGVRPVATATVACRATVTLTPAGLLRVANLVHSPAGEALAMLATAAEQASPQAARHVPRLAAALGFADWDALYAWQASHGVTAGERLWRELIGWDVKTLVAVDG
jgi:hypothetical protein